MEKYKDYEITVMQNDEKEYPFKAILRKGDKEIKHKGQSELQAIDYAKQTINKMESKHAL